MRALRAVGILLALILVAGPVQAEEVPRLLADVNRTPPSPLGNTAAQPSGFIPLGDRMLFSTAGVGIGDEGLLWITDGTASGTRVISSTLCPYPCQGIRSLGIWHGLALLVAATGSSVPGGQLWRTDGTSAGTFPLTEMIQNDPFRTDGAIHPVGDRFFFVACLLLEGCELFRSDGTRPGTAPFTAAGFTHHFFDPHSFASWQDRLVFLAYNDQFSLELWSTDGTPEGTVRLGDVQESEDAPAPVVPTPSRIFFATGETGQDLWVTDGTPGGARRLADFDPVRCYPPPERYCDTPDVNSLTAVGDEVIFLARRPENGYRQEIWRSDGTESGPRPIFEVPPAQFWGLPERLATGGWIVAVAPPNGGPLTLWTTDGDFSHAAPLAGCDGGCPEFQGYLSPAPLPRLFVGQDAAHGSEVWITDGTGAGTRLLADICPGPCSGYRSRYGIEPVLGTAAGRTWFLAFSTADADDGSNDEVWVTDGTPAGTHRVTGHVASGLGFLGDLAFFGLGGRDRDTAELWSTDGSSAGTRQVTVLQRLAPGSFPYFLPRETGVLLEVDDGTHNALWQSDGTPGGTAPLIALPQGLFFGKFFQGDFTQVGNLQFFTVVGEDRSELWRTDGTAPGTFRVVRLDPGAQTSLQTSWKGKLLFQLEEHRGCTFWISDGTPRGTRQILPQPPGRRCPTAVQAIGSRFLFVARVQKEGRGPIPQIFLSDGKVAGTRQISQIRYSRPPLEGEEPVTAGGITFFRIFLPHSLDSEVWRTDGTGAGTYRAFNLTQLSGLFGFRGSLYFAAFPNEGSTLTLYRAPAAGGAPVPLAELSPTFGATAFTPVGDRLFFVAADDEAGAELWVTDGTPTGTHRVRDIHPGPASSDPGSFVEAGDRLFFAAEDGEHGRELWVSDGTEAGTRLVWDLNPGGFSSFPTNLVVSEGSLFFSADDGETGIEPWAMRLEP